MHGLHGPPQGFALRYVDDALGGRGFPLRGKQRGVTMGFSVQNAPKQILSWDLHLPGRCRSNLRFAPGQPTPRPLSPPEPLGPGPKTRTRIRTQKQ